MNGIPLELILTALGSGPGPLAACGILTAALSEQTTPRTGNNIPLHP
jgi:hypothetical protein